MLTGKMGWGCCGATFFSLALELAMSAWVEQSLKMYLRYSCSRWRRSSTTWVLYRVKQWGKIVIIMIRSSHQNLIGRLSKIFPCSACSGNNYNIRSVNCLKIKDRRLVKKMLWGPPPRICLRGWQWWLPDLPFFQRFSLEGSWSCWRRVGISGSAGGTPWIQHIVDTHSTPLTLREWTPTQSNN